MAAQDTELIRQGMSLKSTDELQAICRACDFELWTPQAIEVAREVLGERGVTMDQRDAPAPLTGDADA